MIQIKVFFPRVKEIRRFKIKDYSELEMKSKTVFADHYSKFSNFVFFYQDVDKDWITFSSKDEWPQALEYHDKSKGFMIIKVFCKTYIIKNSPHDTIYQKSEKEITSFVKNIPEKIDELLNSMVDEIPKGIKKMEDFTSNIPKKVKDFNYQTKKNLKTIKKKVVEKVEDLKKLLTDPEKQKPKKVNKKSLLMSVHSDVLCDNCKCCPIIGKRYHCLNKSDYDLCEECFAKRKDFGMENFSFDVFMDKDKVISTFIPEDDENKYNEQLGLLSGMGFDDKKLNLKLLKKHDGNIANVVSEIIKM